MVSKPGDGVGKGRIDPVVQRVQHFAVLQADRTQRNLINHLLQGKSTQIGPQHIHKLFGLGSTENIGIRCITDDGISGGIDRIKGIKRCITGGIEDLVVPLLVGCCIVDIGQCPDTVFVHDKLEVPVFGMPVGFDKADIQIGHRGCGIGSWCCCCWCHAVIQKLIGFGQIIAGEHGMTFAVIGDTQIIAVLQIQIRNIIIDRQIHVDSFHAVLGRDLIVELQNIEGKDGDKKYTDDCRKGKLFSVL